MHSKIKKLSFAISLSIIGILLYFIYVTYAVYQENRRIDELTFSNTQTWDEKIYTLKEWPTPFLGEGIPSIMLPTYPANRSRETQEELQFLHELATVRTEARLAEIQRELQLNSTHFNNQSFQALLAEKFQTQQLIQAVLPEFSALVLTQKEYYNRVRPSILDRTLTTTIDIPGHPAYPSGHAAQSMLIALILGSLDPANAEIYKDDAERIGHNREIAGVHYPSDSRAGRELASRYFDLLSAYEPFQEILEQAKTEWQ